MINFREELEKEEMYVEYLDKLLADIELHKHKSNGESNGDHEDVDGLDDGEVFKDPEDLDLTVTSGSLDKKQKLKENQDDGKPRASLRSSLHLDLESKEAPTKVSKENVQANGSSFVTVINVTSTEKSAQNNSSHDQIEDQSLQPGSKFTFTKSKSSFKKTDTVTEGFSSFGKKMTKPVPAARRQDSRESLNSISSPLSPTSPSLSLSENPLLSPREAPASPREHALIAGVENEVVLNKV